MFVKIFVIVSLIIWGLIGCATNGSYNQSEKNNECALAGRAFMYSCISRR